MDYSTEQVKSIFDLIKEATIYSYPLLLSLIFPLIWVVLKKILGFESNIKIQAEEPKTLWQKIKFRFNSIISVCGNSIDRFVFVFSICLFLIGGIFLKYGENREEKVRQKALSLKQYFLSKNYLYTEDPALRSENFSEEEINNIIDAFPSEFIRVGGKTYCVDTIVQKKVYKFIIPLIDSYVETKFRNNDTIYLEDLFEKDSLINFKNYFSQDVRDIYVSKIGRTKNFTIDVINHKSVLIKKVNIEKIR